MKYKVILCLFIGFTFVLLGQDEFSTLDDDIIGTTYYDLQTWRTMQNRIYVFDDGRKGSVWNMGMDYPNFPDLGVGYNFFDGEDWGAYPTQSITSGWAVNPSYTAYLENGEICVSQGENGLIVSIRENRGTGDWQEGYLPGSGFKHPVVVTSGVDHSIIQLLYLKADESFTPTPAQPVRGYIWYARSSDGGLSWDMNQPFFELGPDYYRGFTIGSYCWAEPNEDVIAFTAGDYLTDLVLMKSEDGGDTWQKTVIWEHPFPLFEIFTVDSDTFYSNNGGISVALDNQNKANVVFTLSRVFSSTEQDTIWYDPDDYGGVVYWNEDRPTFSSDIMALCPYPGTDDCPYSELVEDYSLIGWLQDINGNDSIDLLDDIRTYPTPGMCTMPQILIDEWNRIIVIYSAIAETYSNGTANLRHIWVRLSPNGEWWSDFTDLSASPIYIISECVYPSIASFVDEEFYFTFQEDTEPGLTNPMVGNYAENSIQYMSVYLEVYPLWVYANFIADTTIIHEGDTVSFINQSSGYPSNNIQYLWTFEGGIPQTSYDTNPQIVYSNEGIYDVQLLANIINTTCIDTKIKEDYITVLPATKINKIKPNENIEIYPNPGNGLFTINLNHEKTNDLTIGVYNILGEQIIQLPFEKGSGQLRLDLTAYDNGIYFVQIKHGSTLITKKIAVRQ